MVLQNNLPEVWVIFGPTASGKSGAAVEIAEAVGGAVINADSRQIYQRIPIVAAVPTLLERRGVAHYLFEYKDPAERMSAARWAEDAEKAIENVRAAGGVPIVVGGTGLYLRALMEGLSEIPAVPQGVEDELRNEDVAELYRHLRDVDGVLADKLNPNDRQRILRGLAVYMHTGTPLSVWQERPGRVPPYRFRKLALNPARDELYARIERRWAEMIKCGAVEEVQALRDAGYTLDMPGLQGLGIVELFDFIEGRLSFEEASRVAVQGTRHYAKRQVTWLRHTFRAEQTFAEPAGLVAFITAAMHKA